MQWVQHVVHITEIKPTIWSCVAKWRLRLWDVVVGRSYKTTVRGWVVDWTGSLRILMAVVKVSWTFEFHRSGKFIHLLKECQILNTKSAGVDTYWTRFVYCRLPTLFKGFISYYVSFILFHDLLLSIISRPEVSGASVAQPRKFSRPPCCFCRLYEIKIYCWNIVT